MAENACAQLRETSKIPVPGTFTVRRAKVPGESEVSGGGGFSGEAPVLTFPQYSPVPSPLETPENACQGGTSHWMTGGGCRRQGEEEDTTPKVVRFTRAARVCSPVPGSCLVTKAVRGLTAVLLEGLCLHGVRQPGVHASAFCEEVLNNEKKQYAPMGFSQLRWAGWILGFLSPVGALREQPLNWGWNRDPPGSFTPKRGGAARCKS